MVDPDMQALVFDIGTETIKSGFSGDDAPKNLIPSVVGKQIVVENKKSRRRNDNDGANEKYIFGSDKIDNSTGLELSCALQHGAVSNWNTFEKLMHHTFYNTLRVTPEEHPLLVTENPHNPENNREKMCHMFFETFNLPAFYVTLTPILSVYASGRCSAFCLEIGAGCVSCLPIYEGYTIPKSILRQDIGGRDVDNYLVRLLKRKDYAFDTDSSKRFAKVLKEKKCFVSQDFERDLTISETSGKYEENYTLPDKRKIVVGSERYRAMEVLFKPSFIGKELMGIHELLFKGITNAPIYCRKDFYANMLCTGGSTLSKGFNERMTDEMKKLIPKDCRWCKVLTPNERLWSVWIGGSILSSLSTFQNMWITKDEYDDAGPSIVQRKCP